MKRRHFLILLIPSALVAASAVFFAVWSRSLFARLDHIVSRRAGLASIRLYSDAFPVRAGSPMSKDFFGRAAFLHGYVENRNGPLDPGEFEWMGDGARISLRGSSHTAFRSKPGVWTVLWGRSGIASIDGPTGPGGGAQDFFLEPVLLNEAGPGGADTRPYVRLQDLPRHLIDALIVSEDRRFYEHHGLSLRGVARAMWINLRRGGLVQGGSTLTQQLAKNAFLSQERTLRRKVTETALALAMEARYSKNDILEIYFNQIYMGRDGRRSLYGVEDASRAYFGKRAADLELAEAALLVGLIPAPNAYHPRSAPEKATAHRNEVLRLLSEFGKTDPAASEAARKQSLELAPALAGVGDYFVDWAYDLLEPSLRAAAEEGSAVHVVTSLHLPAQDAAERALSSAPSEGAVVVMDPREGFVRVLVGGRNFTTSPFNRASRARRQPGSAFKPILLAAGLESKAFTLATVVEDKPVEIDVPNGSWSPANYDGRFRGTSTVRDAIVFSLNVPSVHMLELTGPDAVARIASALGIDRTVRTVPSLALGTSEVSPLELTRAYAALANGGLLPQIKFVRAVADERGMWPSVSGQPVAAMSPETAALVTDVLRDVLRRGTARAASAMGLLGDAAGKTGTTDNFKDLWFAGYRPDAACVVWLGHDKPASLGKPSSSLALPVWVNVMNALPDREDFPPFPGPLNIVKCSIDPSSGLLARSGCPEVRVEYFVDGTRPVEHCGLHAGGVKGLFRRFMRFFKKAGPEDGITTEDVRR